MEQDEAKLTKAQKKALKAARRAQTLTDRGDKPEDNQMKNKAQEKAQTKAPEKQVKAPKPQPAAVAQVKEGDSRVRKNSERQVKPRVPMKSQQSQAELTEPLFTYMRNSFGVNDIIENMGFGTKDPFSKSDQPVDLHPAIVRLGFKAGHCQFGGATQKAQKLMHAITEFIEDFKGRKFEDSSDGRGIRQSVQQQFIQELNPNINFLSKCRPLVRSEAWVINTVKEQSLSREGQKAADTGISEFKNFLIEQLDHFWSTRVISAGLTISTESQHLIKENSTVMTFGGSQNVFRIFEQANRSGKAFSVIVVDCEPDLKGKTLANSLSEIGVDCRYATIAGLSYMMAETDIVMLAAQSLLANGSVVCSKGSGIVACVAKEDQVPVLVCCETYKFDDRCAINALDNKNELREFAIDGGRRGESISFVDIVHDVIPASLVTACITEVGIIPSTSVATIIRENEKKRQYLEDIELDE